LHKPLFLEVLDPPLIVVSLQNAGSLIKPATPNELADWKPAFLLSAIIDYNLWSLLEWNGASNNELQ
jgi:hypothetical protein